VITLITREAVKITGRGTMYVVGCDEQLADPAALLNCDVILDDDDIVRVIGIEWMRPYRSGAAFGVMITRGGDASVGVPVLPGSV
jgi:hypothetical protein